MAKSERERLLAVATPEEWDCWIERQAQMRFGPPAIEYACLFCRAFNKPSSLFDDDDREKAAKACAACSPDTKYHKDCYRCNAYDDEEKIDRAIARLEAAGIWED